MGRKGVVTRSAAVVFKGGALKQLKRGTTRTGGRNNLGRITSFHRGGGAKRALRQIDLKRSVPDLTGTVERIEYDPVRTGRIALVRWEGDNNSPTSTPGGEEKEIESGGAYKKIKDMQRRALPRGIHDMPRRALRSAVATICGVPLASCGKRWDPVTVNIDGKKKFSSFASDSEFFKERQFNFFLKDTERLHCDKLDTLNENMIKTSPMNGRSWEKNLEEYGDLLKKFKEVLQVERVS